MMDMLERDEKIFQMITQGKSEAQYVEESIKRAEKYFNLDVKSQKENKGKMGYVMGTRVDTPDILKKPLFNPSLSLAERKKTAVWGNLKAIVPLMREKFIPENVKIGNVDKPRKRKMGSEPLREKRIFGLFTARQVGHIPNLQTYFTEDQTVLNRDTYTFKPFLGGQTSVRIDLDSEIYKQTVVNDYRRSDIANDLVDNQVSPGTVHQIQVFHKWLISDLYSKQKVVDYAACMSGDHIQATKHYYIVPLKLVKPPGGSDSSSQIEYEVDVKLLRKVEAL